VKTSDDGHVNSSFSCLLFFFFSTTTIFWKMTTSDWLKSLTPKLLGKRRLSSKDRREEG